MFEIFLPYCCIVFLKIPGLTWSISSNYQWVKMVYQFDQPALVADQTTQQYF